MKITNNRGGHVTIVPHPDDKKGGETVVLAPGENELTEAQWDKISEHKTIMGLLKKKAIHIGGKHKSKQAVMRRHPEDETEAGGTPVGVMDEIKRKEQREADALYKKQQEEGAEKAKAAAKDKK